MNADDIVNGRTGIAAAALLATVGLGLMWAQTPTMAAPFDGMSEIAKLAARGGLDAIDAMLDARSPGFRMPGALTQTKERRISSLKDAFTPKERVLPKERGEAPAIAYETGAVVGPGPVAPVGPAALPEGNIFVPDAEPLPPVAGIYPTGGGYYPPVIVPGGGGGGGGGGSGGGTPPGGPNTPPGVDSPVPEPATWAMLLIGFFAIGFGLRTSPARQPARRLDARAFQ